MRVLKAYSGGLLGDIELILLASLCEVPGCGLLGWSLIVDGAFWPILGPWLGRMFWLYLTFDLFFLALFSM